MSDGTSVGSAVGRRVIQIKRGAKLCSAEGESDGAGVGAFDGRRLGAGVGESVGDLVFATLHVVCLHRTSTTGR